MSNLIHLNTIKKKEEKTEESEQIEEFKKFEESKILEHDLEQMNIRNKENIKNFKELPYKENKAKDDLHSVALSFLEEKPGHTLLLLKGIRIYINNNLLIYLIHNSSDFKRLFYDQRKGNKFVSPNYYQRRINIRKYERVNVFYLTLALTLTP
uniref:Uncharacterized protein n=1 Tax=Acrobeloides nanus TaxID=290746 RepID=A0A914CRM7_9BILA